MAVKLSIQHMVMEYIINRLKEDEVIAGLVKGYYHLWPSETMWQRIDKGNLYPFITCFCVSSIPEYFSGYKSDRIRIQIDIFDKDIPNASSNASQRISWLTERVEAVLDDAPITATTCEDEDKYYIDIWRENTSETSEPDADIKRAEFDYLVEVFRRRE